MMLNSADFKHGDCRYTDYITEITFMGEKIQLDIFFEDALGKNEETLAAALPEINRKLGFIEANKDAVLHSSVDDAKLDALAEEWIADLAENADDETVTLEDGSTIPARVTPERFLASLYPAALGFEFSESTDLCRAYLELCCKPDYFAGHRVRIEINEENEISCDGI